MGRLNLDTTCASISLRGAHQVPTEPPSDATASCEQKADAEDCREHPCCKAQWGTRNCVTGTDNRTCWPCGPRSWAPPEEGDVGPVGL